MSGWLRRIAIEPLLALMKEGLSPEKLAQSVAYGLVIAVFPVLGLTTLMAAVAALTLKLNMHAIQIINYLAYPLQFLLLIPFYRAGESLFHEVPLPWSPLQIIQMFRMDPLSTMGQLWGVTWHAAVVWLIFAPPMVALLSLLLTQVFRKFARELALP